MKSSQTLLVLMTMVSMLCGCTGLSTYRTTTQELRFQTDSERMAKIEHAARRSGAEVIWVNPPKKKEKN